MKPHFPDPSLPPLFIVDDCEDDIFLLRHRLREAEITNPVLAFTSPADALAFLRSIRARHELPAMVFTEIKMPVGSGLAFIAAIRENRDWDGIQIAVVTMSNDTADLEHALENGANGYLIKFPPEELLADFVRNGPRFAVPRRTPAMANALSV